MKPTITILVALVLVSCAKDTKFNEAVERGNIECKIPEIETIVPHARVKFEAYDESGARLVERGYLVYLENSEILYSGKAVNFYECGQQSLEMQFKDGEPDGFERHWHENGQLRYEAYWNAGKGEGLEREYHSNGQKSYEVYWKEGMREGPESKWHFDGQLAGEANYTDGEMDGLMREWDSEGRLSREWNYKDGKAEGLQRIWYGKNRKEEIRCYTNNEWVDLSYCQ